MEPKVERLRAVDDGGRPCTLLRITPYRLERSLDGETWVDLLPSVQTEDGEHCNPVGRNQYAAIHSGRTFRLVE